MTTENPVPKKTVLFDWHLANHATMAEFGGYQMPLWYPSGAKQEHRVVLTGVGLFDTSHMSVLIVAGTTAESLLQLCFTRDLRACIGAGPNPLTQGRCVYGLFLREDGTVLDDAIISQLGPERYMVVVNSGMGPPVQAHLLQHAAGGVEVVDFSGRIGKIDVQGPAAARVMARLLDDPEQVLPGMVYFSCKGDVEKGGSEQIVLRDKTPILLSRTGYTGEFGFEIYVSARDTVAVWEQLLAAGRDQGIMACGLAARDSLRTGAVLPLSHQDIGDWPFENTPWSFVLPWDKTGSQFTKQFIGAERVKPSREESFTYPFAGYDPRKIPVTEKTTVLDARQESIGSVLTCTTDMGIDRVGDKIVSIATAVSAGRPADFQPRGLSCGFVKTRRPCAIGETLVLTDGRRSVPIEIRRDIRPDRTARRSMRDMRNEESKLRGETR